jgi:hypothetical protein
MVFGGMGTGSTGVAGAGTGWTGFGITGTGVGVTGSIGAGEGAMGGPIGLSVCAGVCKTTSILIMVRDRSVRVILFFIYVSVWLFASGCRQSDPASSI